MSVSYTSILWNQNKKRYDIGLTIVVLSFLTLFIVLNAVFHPSVTYETIVIRAFGWLAILLLQVILVIGPLARLNPAFNVILYNRRHLGVTMFLMATVHGGFSIMQFHALGDMNPIKSVFLSNLHYDSLIHFPYQVLGFIALIVLGLMATSSHDFWLKNLGVRTWKALHMMVYFAYGLLIMHVVLGGLQNETHPAIFLIVFLSFSTVASLHIISGFQERKQLVPPDSDEIDSFVFGCIVSEIKDDCAKVVTIAGNKVAIFKYDGQVSAVSNVCRHQGGPLGEGKVVDGCITCPWHGYQYHPGNGQSPPPFTEKIETYKLKLQGDKVYIDPIPNTPGTPLEPIKLKYEG